MKITSSSAVTKRPRDASCLSVFSFIASIVKYLERSFFIFLVTLALNLPVRTIRFCYVVFGVTLSLAVMHTIRKIAIFSKIKQFRTMVSIDDV